MNRDGQDLIIIEEGFLNTVAVVGINVNVSHPQPLLPEVFDGQGRVVEYTKYRGMIGGGVVQSAGDTESHIHLAVD